MSKKVKKTLLVIILLLSLVCIGFILEKIVHTRTVFYKNNVSKDTVLYVQTGSLFGSIIDSLRTNKILLDEATFLQAAQVENSMDKIRPGRYRVKKGMSNTKLLRMLKMGWQEPVNIVIAGNIRSNEKLAAVLSRSIEADSVDILQLFSNDSVVSLYGYTPATVMGMVVPNTYQVYWDISPEQLLQRLNKEFVRFWNDTRSRQQALTGLTRDEVITLASIVNEETNKTDEMPSIVGVYINRLKKGMPLQADPTLKYAINDFTIKRVLDRHKSVNSPYNTYANKGLPPGPIGVPSIVSIDAVLNYEQNEYLYFCAKDDFSGYHVFTKTLAQHNKNAEKYRQALNRNRIYR